MRTAHPYPFVNAWRKGSWVARPTGKSDRDYVYGRDFCQGKPDKATGTLRYTLADLGGTGWVVARDPIRGTRNLIELRELEWVEHPEVPASDILEVVHAGQPVTPGAWTGEVCADHQRALIGETPCPDCEADQEREARRELVGAAPDPF